MADYNQLYFALKKRVAAIKLLAELENNEQVKMLANSLLNSLDQRFDDRQILEPLVSKTNELENQLKKTV